MSAHIPATIVLALILTLTAGCTGGRDDGPRLGADGTELARQARAKHGSADELTFTLVISVRPEDGDAVNFSLFAWCDENNRTRIRATKLDVDFLDGLIAADGSFVVGLVRSEEVVTGRLDDLAVTRTIVTESGEEVVEQRVPPGASFFASIGRIVDEAKHGPVPAAETYTVVGTGDHTVLRCTHAEDTATRVAISGRHHEAAWKELYDGDEKLLRIDYQRYQIRDRMRRPIVATLTFPDSEAVVRTRYRRIDQVPGFRPGTFTYEPPTDWKRIGVDAFIERLVERDAEDD